MIYKSKISIIETYLPKKKTLIKNNNRLLEKTGIEKVWKSSKNETSLDMGYKSALKLKTLRYTSSCNSLITVISARTTSDSKKLIFLKQPP